LKNDHSERCIVQRAAALVGRAAVTNTMSEASRAEIIWRTGSTKTNGGAPEIC
jgi:hypothetical protein